MHKLADEERTIGTPGIVNIKQIIGAVAFIAIALFLASVVPSIEIAWVSAILVLTIYLFAFEIVDVDVAAIAIMVLLGLTGLFAPVMGLEQGLVDSRHLFDGFSSNAVISIIAVMIIGAGLDKTGVMNRVAGPIINLAGKNEKRIIALISGTVGVISSMMQNIGAAARAMHEGRHPVDVGVLRQLLRPEGIGDAPRRLRGASAGKVRHRLRVRQVPCYQYGIRGGISFGIQGRRTEEGIGVGPEVGDVGGQHRRHCEEDSRRGQEDCGLV